MIDVERRTISLNRTGFKNSVKMLCRRIRKHNPNQYGIGVKQLNEHFKIKLTLTDFYELSEVLEFTVRRGKFWYFDEVLKIK